MPVSGGSPIVLPQQPSPFDEIGKTLLQALLTREQIKTQREEQKIREREMSLREQEAAAKRQAEEAANQAALSILMSQAQPPPGGVPPEGIGAGVAPPGMTPQAPFVPDPDAQAAVRGLIFQNLRPVAGRTVVPSGLTPQQAGAALPLVQRQQQHRAAVEQSRSQTRLAEQEFKQNEKLFDLRRAALEAQIARDQAATAAERRRADLAERQYETEVRSLARRTVSELHGRADRLRLAALESIDPETRRRANEIANIAVFGTPDRPDDKTLIQIEMQTLDSLVGAAPDKETLNAHLEEQRLTRFQTAAQLSTEQRRRVEQALASTNDPQRAYDSFADQGGLDDATLGAIAVYLRLRTGADVKPREKRDIFGAFFRSISRAIEQGPQVGPMTGFIGGAARGFVASPPSNRTR